MTQPAQLSALLRKEEDIWVLQCLDFDIAVQAGSIPDLVRDFERVINGHIMLDLQAGRRPLEDLPAAPDFYWDAFRSGLRAESFRLRLVEAPVRRAIAKQLRITRPKRKTSVSEQMPMPWITRSIVSEMRVA